MFSASFWISARAIPDAPAAGHGSAISPVCGDDSCSAIEPPSRRGDRTELRPSTYVAKYQNVEVDPRQIYARLTDRGFEVLAEATPTHVAGIRERFLERLSAEQTEQLAAIWRAVRGP